ncbi:MAG: hypothetical protein IID40_09900, partial [Planctomycetes bacterium]|nr:hypothetical protein [Planctomycetota bacterium]
MAQVQRRVILKPAGLTDEQSARLAELLGAAIERQRQLATKSMHVLELTGNLQQNEQAFFVEHEPAEPFPTAGLFDPEVDGADEKTLLRLSAAIFGALGSAHSSGDRPYAPGGLCPGTILETPDKIIKISDFGMAAAICNALGVESYTNLAAGPRVDGPPETLGTVAWEILGADVDSREDRICSFIDPQKYGMQALGTFEPGSDVIAAGFILHLMAEHQHPYLYSVDPAAHLLPEMSEFMAEMRYNGARRQDLRESTDPAVRLWCDLVAKALGRLPENRPSSVEIGQALSAHVKPVDAGEILRSRLETIEELAKEGNWVQIRSQAKGIADNDEAPADVAERANALLRLAAAWLLLDQATELLKGDEWPTAQQPL